MKKLATFLGVVAMAAITPLARADFSISVNGVTCNSGAGNPANPGGESGVCLSVPAGGATISVVSTKGTQTASNSRQFTTSLEIDNSAGPATTITIRAAVNNFTLPNTPPDITDSFGYTLNGTSGSVTASSYKACVDQSNGLTAPTGLCGTESGITVLGAQTKASPEGTLVITTLNPSFSLNQEIVIALAAGTVVTITASQVLTQVPEPAAILLFGTMLVGLTSVVRRKAAKRL